MTDNKDQEPEENVDSDVSDPPEASAEASVSVSASAGLPSSENGGPELTGRPSTSEEDAGAEDPLSQEAPVGASEEQQAWDTSEGTVGSPPQLNPQDSGVERSDPTIAPGSSDDTTTSGISMSGSTLDTQEHRETAVGTEEADAGADLPFSSSGASPSGMSATPSTADLSRESMGSGTSATVDPGLGADGPFSALSGAVAGSGPTFSGQNPPQPRPTAQCLTASELGADGDPLSEAGRLASGLGQSPESTENPPIRESSTSIDTASSQHEPGGNPNPLSGAGVSRRPSGNISESDSGVVTEEVISSSGINDSSIPSSRSNHEPGDDRPFSLSGASSNGTSRRGAISTEPGVIPVPGEGTAGDAGAEFFTAGATQRPWSLPEDSGPEEEEEAESASQDAGDTFSASQRVAASDSGSGDDSPDPSGRVYSAATASTSTDSTIDASDTEDGAHTLSEPGEGEQRPHPSIPGLLSGAPVTPEIIQTPISMPETTSGTAPIGSSDQERGVRLPLLVGGEGAGDIGIISSPQLPTGVSRHEPEDTTESARDSGVETCDTPSEDAPGPILSSSVSTEPCAAIKPVSDSVSQSGAGAEPVPLSSPGEAVTDQASSSGKTGQPGSICTPTRVLEDMAERVFSSRGASALSGSLLAGYPVISDYVKTAIMLENIEQRGRGAKPDDPLSERRGVTLLAPLADPAISSLSSPCHHDRVVCIS